MTVLTISVAIDALDYLGTAAFAVTGALRAMSKCLDLMGAVVLAVVTALGGGMMRDALIGHHPPTAFIDQSYLLIAIVLGILTFFWGRHIREQESWLITIDAVGLGVFTLVGATVADQAGLSACGILFIAMLTATGGGVLRAMMVAEIPFILNKEIYASAGLIGALAYLLLKYIEASNFWVFFIVMVMTTGVRLIAWRYHMQLPRA
ncbi:trimeric intracellular cation channel family protein [Mariprofundus ferrooxydans]|nr:trimeric intracellular cation channel family protein [Mariprofundus ferrooxydans]